MTRATETGELILSQLPASTHSQPCPLIQEVSFLRPIPPAGKLSYYQEVNIVFLRYSYIYICTMN